MYIAGDGVHGRRLRGLVVVLWRAGLRIDEAIAPREADLDRRRGSLGRAPGSGAPPPGPACADALLHISCDTPTLSRWPEKASR
jgi:hypothetical protein